MAAQTILVTKLTGQAWIRGSDGNLTVIHEGMRIPADAQIVTASGSTVQLQADGQPLLIVGENQNVQLTADLVQPPLPTEAAIANPANAEIDQIIAAINNGQDPFENIDPTAAGLSGGSEGGSTFVRLASIIEAVSPIALAYPRPAGAQTQERISSGVMVDEQQAPPPASPLAPAANPLAQADQGRIFEEDAAPLRGNVLGNDQLGQGTLAQHSTMLVGSAQGQYGVVSLNTDGSYSYVLDNSLQSVQSLAVGETLSETYTYTVTDAAGSTSSSTLTITVVGMNDNPAMAGEVTGSVTEDAQLTASGQLTETDVDISDTHTWTVNNGGQGSFGNLVVDGNGKWIYTLDNDNPAVQAFAGGEKREERFEITVDDGHGGIDTKTVTVNIQGLNDAPETDNTSGKGAEDAAAIAVALKGSDVDGTVAEFVINSVSAEGKLMLGTVELVVGSKVPATSNAAEITFVPNANWNGQTTFTYASIDNDKLEDPTPATGTITVDGLNDAPTGANNTVTALEDGSYAFKAADFGFRDAAVDTPAHTLQSITITALPTNGTLSFNGTPVTKDQVIAAGEIGKLVFKPAPDASGNNYAQFGFKVTDNGGADNGGVNISAEHQITIDVTPVADVPLVTVNVGADLTPITVSIDTSTVSSLVAGHTVTAYGPPSSGGVKPVGIVSTVTGTKHDGFGVAGVASGDDRELGRSSAGSESLEIKFNIPVTSITVQFAWLASREKARYQMFDEAGKAVPLGYNVDGIATVGGLYGFVTGVSDEVDDQFILSVPQGNTISKIVFDAPGADDDYLIHKVTYTTATTYPITITATPQDLDYSETITKVTVEVPKGVTLSAGTQIDATHWSLPLASNGSYSVIIDQVTKAVTITGLNMTVPENVQVNEIKVVAVAAEGSSTAEGSASFTSKPDAVDDTNRVTLSSTSRPSPLANFDSGDSGSWKFDSANRLDKSNSDLRSSDWKVSEISKWLVSSLNDSTLDASSGNGGLVLRDNNGNGDNAAKAVTPTYTSTVAGATLQFTAANFSNVSNSDSVIWTLYKSINGGSTWAEVTGQAQNGVILTSSATPITITTTALELNATYRILLIVNDGSKNNGNAAVTFDDFMAMLPAHTTGSVTSNDTLGTLGETPTLSVLNGSTWVDVASDGTTIAGSYGTLLIKADGSYTYTPTASVAGAGKVEHFDYKLTQADGDTDTASLNISIDATGPGATTLAASRMTLLSTDTASHEVHSTPSGGSLLGTAEDDLFVWHQGDAGAAERPVTDVVKNFGASGNDALDLADLLQGEEASSDLSKFLHLETRTEADGKTIDTVIKVSTAGVLDAYGNGFNQKILVEDVDLVGTSHDQNAMIKQLIDQGKLKID